MIVDSIKFLSFDVGEAINDKFHYREIIVNFDSKAVRNFDFKLIPYGRFPDNDSMIYNIKALMQSVDVNIIENIKENEGIEGFYAWDSIAIISYLVKTALRGSELLINNLMDSGKTGALLCGEKALFTAHGIPKPAFQGYKMLNLMKGELIAFDDSFLISRSENDIGEKQFYLLFINCSTAIDCLCEKKYGMRKVQEEIEKFKDSLEIKVTIAGFPSGMYQIIETAQLHKDSLFNFANTDNYIRKSMSDNDILTTIEISSPVSQGREEYIHGDLELTVNLKGLGYKFIRIIQKQK